MKLEAYTESEFHWEGWSLYYGTHRKEGGSGIMTFIFQMSDERGSHT